MNIRYKREEWADHVVDTLDWDHPTLDELAERVDRSLTGHFKVCRQYNSCLISKLADDIMASTAFDSYEIVWDSLGEGESYIEDVILHYTNEPGFSLKEAYGHNDHGFDRVYKLDMSESILGDYEDV